MAHKPSLSKSPEQVKTSPTHALKAASTADRDSAPQKSRSPTYYRTPEESARIQKLAQELARREIEKANATATGGVKRSDLTRVATLSMQRKTAADLAEHEKEAARKRQVEEEAITEYNNQRDLDDVARRIVAERLARVTLTGEEGDEVLAGKAAGDAVYRGDKRVKDWEEILKTLDTENKTDRERGTGWLRQSMRSNAPLGGSRQDPSMIMAAAQRNVAAQMNAQDKSIAEEQLILGKPTGENAARRDAHTRDLEQKGNADLQRVQKERASIPISGVMLIPGTYDIGGIMMTHEQVEAIAQKHVNEVLAEINEKVEREKERIEQERLEREARQREKEAEKQAAREKAAEEKAEKEKLKQEQREHKAEEKRIKEEAKMAEKKKKEEAKTAQKELKQVTKEQLAVGEGIVQYDAEKEKEGELAKERALNEVTGDQTHAVEGVLQYDAEKDKEAEIKGIQERVQKQKMSDEASRDQAHAVEGVLQDDSEKDEEEFRKFVDERAKANETLNGGARDQAQAAEVGLNPDTALDDDPAKGGRIKSWFKEKIGRRLSRHGDESSGPSGPSASPQKPSISSPIAQESKAEDEEEEDLYGTQNPIASNWRSIDPTSSSKPREDSLRNVALAKPDSPSPIPKVNTAIPSAAANYEEPHEITDLTAYKAGNYEDLDYTSGEDEFDDAEEEFEEPSTGAEKLGIKDLELERKISGERASRFKEEF